MCLCGAGCVFPILLKVKNMFKCFNLKQYFFIESVKCEISMDTKNAIYLGAMRVGNKKKLKYLLISPKSHSCTKWRYSVCILSILNVFLKYITKEHLQKVNVNLVQ